MLQIKLERKKERGALTERSAGINGKIREGSADINGKITEGSADINMKITEGSADVNGKITEGSADIKGKITEGSADANGKTTEQTLDINANVVNTLGNCFFCGQATSLLCRFCQGVYYCSEVTQRHGANKCYEHSSFRNTWEYTDPLNFSIVILLL